MVLLLSQHYELLPPKSIAGLSGEEEYPASDTVVFIS